MDRPEAVRLLTLWFATAAFLQTTSGPSNAVVTAASFVALGVLYVVPVLLLAALTERSGISILPDYDSSTGDHIDD